MTIFPIKYKDIRKFLSLFNNDKEPNLSGGATYFLSMFQPKIKPWKSK